MLEQEAYQPQPGDFEAKLKALFPNAGLREAARASLRRYGSESWHHEVDRVRLAILRLAGADLTAIDRRVDGAIMDYRDTVAAAEFPAYTSLPTGTLHSAPEAQAAIKADREQYLSWMKQP